MWRATWRGLLGHKLRLLLTALAIVLGTGLVAGSYVFTDTLQRVFDDLFADAFSGIDVQIRSHLDPDLGFAMPGRLDESLVDQVASVPGVEKAVPTVGGLITLIAPGGDVAGGSGPPTLAGSWSGEASPLDVLEGRPPDRDGEAAVDAATAARDGIAVGDSVGILSIGEVETFRVVGLVGIGGSTQFGGATLVVFDLMTAQRILAAEGAIDAISVVAESGVAPEELISRLGPVLPPRTEAVSAQTAAEEQLATFKDALGFLNTFLLVFGFVSLFVGAFLIQNTFRIVVAQRTRELALLRALGATRRQVTLMVLGEAAIVGVLASLVGVVLGIGLAALIRVAFEALGGDLPVGALRLQPRTVAVAVAAGTIVSLVSAYLPARRAGRIPPVAAMREGLVDPSTEAARRRLWVAAGICGAGAIVLGIGLTVEIETERIPEIALVGVGAGILFIGLAALAPGFARPAGRLIGAPLPRLLGATGRLARENAVRNPPRTAATASALMIGVALVALVAIVGSTIRATTDALVADRFRSDLVVQAAGFGAAGLSPMLADELEEVPAVRAVARIRRGPVEIDGRVEMVRGADMSTLEQTIGLHPVAGELEDVTGDRLAVAETEAAERGWDLGSRVDIDFAATGSAPFTVAAIFEDEGPGPDIYLGLDAWEENFVERFDTSLFLAFADDADPALARESVEEVVDRYPGATVLDQTEFRDQAVSQLDAFILLIFALLALALVIGFVGIANTLLLSVYERTREIGLLRAVGTTRRQLRRMVTWESVIIAVFGSLLGTGVGVLFGWAIVLAIQGDTPLVFVIPVGRLAVGIVAAGMAGIVAAVVPARRAARLDILRAIAYE